MGDDLNIWKRINWNSQQKPVIGCGNQVAIHNEQFKQVEAWLIHDDVIAALGMDKNSRVYCCEGKKNLVLLKQSKLILLSARLKKTVSNRKSRMTI